MKCQLFLFVLYGSIDNVWQTTYFNTFSVGQMTDY